MWSFQNWEWRVHFTQIVDSPEDNWDLDEGKKERDASLPDLDVSIL